MRPIAMMLPLLLLGLLLAQAPAMKMPKSRYHAARCIYLGKRCNRKIASKTTFCKPGVKYMSQAKACKKLACRWCKVRGKKDILPCSSKALRTVCGGKPASSPGKRVPPMPRPPSGGSGSGGSSGSGGRSGSKCRGKTFYGDNKIVINLDTLPLPADETWKWKTMQGLRGMEYKPGGGGGIDSPGKGVICIPVQYTSGGGYMMTIVSNGQHNTEHNDVWVKSSIGFDFYQGSNYWTSSSGYVKLFQNEGKNVISLKGRTKDHDGHRFTVTGTTPGQVASICLSGRSTRFTVFSVLLVKCQQNSCQNGKLLASYSKSDRGMCR